MLRPISVHNSEFVQHDSQPLDSVSRPADIARSIPRNFTSRRESPYHLPSYRFVSIDDVQAQDSLKDVTASRCPHQSALDQNTVKCRNGCRRECQQQDMQQEHPIYFTAIAKEPHSVSLLNILADKTSIRPVSELDDVRMGKRQQMLTAVNCRATSVEVKHSEVISAHKKPIFDLELRPVKQGLEHAIRRSALPPLLDPRLPVALSVEILPAGADPIISKQLEAGDNLDCDVVPVPHSATDHGDTGDSLLQPAEYGVGISTERRKGQDNLGFVGSVPQSTIIGAASQLSILHKGSRKRRAGFKRMFHFDHR